MIALSAKFFFKLFQKSGPPYKFSIFWHGASHTNIKLPELTGSNLKQLLQKKCSN